MAEFLPIAEQVNILLTARTHPSGRPYTLQEVSEGTGISPATISQLRTGRIHNPQLNTLRALCAFFAVPLRYFETCTVEACYGLLEESAADAAPPDEISEIAFRAIQLSPQAQRDILTIIKWVQAAEAKGAETMLPLPRLTRAWDEEEPGS